MYVFRNNKQKLRFDRLFLLLFSLSYSLSLLCLSFLTALETKRFFFLVK
jgi:hypothetical protein